MKSEKDIDAQLDAALRFCAALERAEKAEARVAELEKLVDEAADFIADSPWRDGGKAMLTRLGRDANRLTAAAPSVGEAPAFKLGDFVEILAGPNEGELGEVSSLAPAEHGLPALFGVRNVAGSRGAFERHQIQLVGGVEAGVAQTDPEARSASPGHRGKGHASGEEHRSCKPVAAGSIPAPSLDPTSGNRPSDVPPDRLVWVVITPDGPKAFDGSRAAESFLDSVPPKARAKMSAAVPFRPYPRPNEGQPLTVQACIDHVQAYADERDQKAKAAEKDPSIGDAPIFFAHRYAANTIAARLRDMAAGAGRAPPTEDWADGVDAAAGVVRAELAHAPVDRIADLTALVKQLEGLAENYPGRAHPRRATHEGQPRSAMTMLEDIIVVCAPDPATGKYDRERQLWEVEQIARHGLSGQPVIPYPGPRTHDAKASTHELDPEHCAACRAFVERNAPPKPPVEVKSELWDAAILKVRQLEAEIRSSGASDREKSNMLHTHSKLWMFATDAWDSEVVRPAQRRAPDYPCAGEREALLAVEKAARARWIVWTRQTYDDLGKAFHALDEVRKA